MKNIMTGHIYMAVTEVRSRLAETIQRLKKKPHDAVIITQRGKIAAVMISLDEYRHLKFLEENAEDKWMASLARNARKEPRGEGITLEEMRDILDKDSA
ncbi:type II toxin-antitoxin system Phd/YefM family antitoxin [Rhodococcus qingshengii]|uniref:type II toxin-antitoxin system Phd/YefM family antitoxin n=1 Tax=Rhodococcus qingshengii TaxID=334542 RepID=UPI0035D5B161